MYSLVSRVLISLYLFITMGLFDFYINEVTITSIYVNVSNMKVEMFFENDPVNFFKIVTTYLTNPIYIFHNFVS